MNMTSYSAHWIRGWLIQNVIPIDREGGELCWGRIGIAVKRDINVANRFQNTPHNNLIVVFLGFENNLIPECTELVLQFR